MLESCFPMNKRPINAIEILKLKHSHKICIAGFQISDVYEALHLLLLHMYDMTFAGLVKMSLYLLKTSENGFICVTTIFLRIAFVL